MSIFNDANHNTTGTSALTEVVQSDKYYKSRAEGVTSEVRLTTDQDLAERPVLKKHDVFYTSAIPEATIQQFTLIEVVTSIAV